MILAIDYDVCVSEKEEGATGICQFFAVVFLPSCLLLLQSCYVARAVLPFKIVLCCYCFVPSVYLPKHYVMLDLLEDNVTISRGYGFLIYTPWISSHACKCDCHWKVSTSLLHNGQNLSESAHSHTTRTFCLRLLLIVVRVGYTGNASREVTLLDLNTKRCSPSFVI